MKQGLTIRAGRKAYDIIKQEGLNLERVKVFAGASGAAKYLVLTGLDRLLISLFSKRTKPLYLIGTSVGAFRMACFAHPDPLSAYDKLQHAYIHQYYPKKPNAHEVSAKSREILSAFIQDDDIKPIINHSVMKLSFISNRCKGLLRFENKAILGAGLLMSFLTNAISRKALGLYFERALFHAGDELPPFSKMNDFPIQNYKLTPNNFKKALLSSGSIPLIMQGINNIEGIDGMFRDGGIVDYHLDIPFLPKDDDDLVLYPHFYSHIIPGWFDKHLNRKARGENLDNLVLIAPSNEFVESLPYQKIPDRNDFKAFQNNDAQRVKFWKKTVELSQSLGEGLYEMIENQSISKQVKPLNSD